MLHTPRSLPLDRPAGSAAIARARLHGALGLDRASARPGTARPQLVPAPATQLEDFLGQLLIEPLPGGGRTQ